MKREVCDDVELMTRKLCPIDAAIIESLDYMREQIRKVFSCEAHQDNSCGR